MILDSGVSACWHELYYASGEFYYASGQAAELAEKGRAAVYVANSTSGQAAELADSFTTQVGLPLS